MAKNQTGFNGKKNSKEFTPTFKKYDNMSEDEKNAYKQGCKSVENKIKENLGLKQKK